MVEYACGCILSDEDSTLYCPAHNEPYIHIGMGDEDYFLHVEKDEWAWMMELERDTIS